MKPDAITDSPRWRKPGETECWLAVVRYPRGGVMTLSKTRFETFAEAKAEATRILAEQKASRSASEPCPESKPKVEIEPEGGE